MCKKQCFKYILKMLMVCGKLEWTPHTICTYSTKYILQGVLKLQSTPLRPLLHSAHVPTRPTTRGGSNQGQRVNNRESRGEIGHLPARHQPANTTHTDQRTPNLHLPEERTCGQSSESLHDLGSKGTIRVLKITKQISYPNTWIF